MLRYFTPPRSSLLNVFKCRHLELSSPFTAGYSPPNELDSPSKWESSSEPLPFTVEADQVLTKRTKFLRVLQWVLHFLLLSVSIVLFIQSIRLTHKANPDLADNTMAYLSSLNAVKNQTDQTSGSSDYQFHCRGPPRGSLDAAWRRISEEMNPITVSEDLMRQVDASALYSTEPDKKFSSNYFVTVEVFHQLHCINLLRQQTFRNYYEGWRPSFGDNTTTFRKHLGHCVKMLHHNLMFNDTTMDFGEDT